MSGRVRIANVTRGSVLADDARRADSFWARLKGLLGRASLEPGEGLVLEPATSVHMIGMRFSIDVLHLNREGEVVKVVPELKPGRLGPYVWRSRTVVELPAGVAAATDTRVGDRLVIEAVA
jgi:uncharacterized membrane protein (UPF0127 family)